MTAKKRKEHTPDGHKVCFATREHFPREEMLRFAISPAHEVVFDESGRLPGRGIWLSPRREAIERAISRKLFSKSIHGLAKIPENLMEQIETALRRRVLSLLGLARKSGALVFGFESVKKEVSAGRVVLAFEANESSAREQDKLYHYTPDLVVCHLFTRSELGAALGQDSVTHIGILNEKAAGSLRRTVQKLELFLQGQKKG